MQRDEDILCGRWRSIRIVGAALVEQDRAGVVLHDLRLRLRGGGGAAIGLVAGDAAAAARVPLETAVAIEIDAPRAGVVAAVVVVGVLAPQRAGFGFLAAIRVDLRNDMNLEVVEQPGGVGVDIVFGDQVFGKARCQLCSRVFAGVNGCDQQKFRLGARDSAVGQLQSKDIVAGRAAGRHLLPTVADVGPRRQLWIGGG